jgi:hypothetical protein
MEWLSSFGPRATFRYPLLADFSFQGVRLPLTDRGRGIRKPQMLSAALSFSTVYTGPREVPPYEDQDGADGLLRYKYRGDDPNHPDNRSLRDAMKLGLPLIWSELRADPIYRPIRSISSPRSLISANSWWRWIRPSGIFYGRQRPS